LDRLGHFPAIYEIIKEDAMYIASLRLIGPPHPILPFHGNSGCQYPPLRAH
jgi:hypothetical protein